MALNRDKYYIEAQNDDAIKLNRIFFDFVQRTFNRLYGLYLHEIFLLIYTIMKDQPRKQSAAEIENLTRTRNQKQNKESNIQAFSKKILFCE